MNTLITWNQLREMEQATQNHLTRFLGRISEQNRQWGDPESDSRRLVTGG